MSLNAVLALLIVNLTVTVTVSRSSHSGYCRHASVLRIYTIVISRVSSEAVSHQPPSPSLSRALHDFCKYYCSALSRSGVGLVHGRTRGDRRTSPDDIAWCSPGTRLAARGTDAFKLKSSRTVNLVHLGPALFLTTHAVARGVIDMCRWPDVVDVVVCWYREFIFGVD